MKRLNREKAKNLEKSRLASVPVPSKAIAQATDEEQNCVDHHNKRMELATKSKSKEKPVSPKLRGIAEEGKQHIA